MRIMLHRTAPNMVERILQMAIALIAHAHRRRGCMSVFRGSTLFSSTGGHRGNRLSAQTLKVAIADLGGGFGQKNRTQKHAHARHRTNNRDVAWRVMLGLMRLVELRKH